MNLAYGLVGILYSLLVSYLRTATKNLGSAAQDMTAEAIENTVFIKAMGWFPWYFSITVIVVLAYGAWRLYLHKDSRNRIDA